MKFNQNHERMVIRAVNVRDILAEGQAFITICPEANDLNYTEIRVRSTTTNSMLAIQLNGPSRKALIEALLAEQEKFD